MPWTVPLLIALAWSIVANLALVSGDLSAPGLAWLGHLELRVHHSRLPPIPPNPEVVVVKIEAETPQLLGLSPATLPLPRRYHAALLRLLREAGVEVAVFDLIFAGPGRPEDDGALRKTLAEAQPLRVVLAATPEPIAADAGVPGGWRYSFGQPIVMPEVSRFVALASPVAFDPGAPLHGAILLRPDEATGALVPHLAFAALLARRDYSAADAKWDRGRNRVTAGALVWPVGEDGEFLNRWTAHRGEFAAIEYSKALEALADPVAREQFRNKIVLIGDTSGSDEHNTQLGRISGVEAVSHVLNTLLLPATADPVRCSREVNAAWGFLLAFGASLAVVVIRPLPIIAGLAGCLFAAVVVPVLMLTCLHVWVDTVVPALCVIGAAMTTGLVEGVRQGTLARRFAPAHIREHRPDTVTEVATVLFLDVRRSTEIAEKVGAEATQGLLGELLARASEVVARHDGEVERTLGDGLLAVFRDRGRRPHAMRATECSGALLRVVQGMAQAWGRHHGVRLEITIGIETGVISGAVIRSADREEWSSFGPNVNLAKRIQEQCGALDARVLMGPTTHALVQERFETCLLGAFPLKGVTGATPIYRLLLDGEESPHAGDS